MLGLTSATPLLVWGDLRNGSRVREDERNTESQHQNDRELLRCSFTGLDSIVGIYSYGNKGINLCS